MKNVIIAAAVLALTATGCGDDAAKKTTAVETPAHSYTAELVKLCDALIAEVVPITGDASTPTGAEYLANREKLLPIWAAFDAKVDALEVPAAEEDVASTFDALRKAGDRADAALTANRARLAALDSAGMMSALDRALSETGFDTLRSELSAHGVSCPAR